MGVGAGVMRASGAGCDAARVATVVSSRDVNVVRIVSGCMK